MNESLYWMQGKNCLNEQQESLAQSHVEMNGERASLLWESLELMSVKFDPVWQMRIALVVLAGIWCNLFILSQGAVRRAHGPHIRPYLFPFWAKADLFLQTLTYGNILAEGLTFWSTQWDCQDYCCPDFKHKGPQGQLETRFPKLCSACAPSFPKERVFPAQSLPDTTHWTAALPAVRILNCLYFLARLCWGRKGRADVSMRNQ